jgi:hypothetical protein
MRRTWSVLAAGALALLIGVNLLGEAFSHEPSGPRSSSYATASDGLAAWAALLSRDGHPVIQLRASLQQTQLSASDTVVVLDPDSLVHSEGERLLEFVRAGGRLLIGGRQPEATLPALLDSPPKWQPVGEARLLAPTGGGASVAGVGEVSSAGEGEWSQTTGYSSPLRGASSGTSGNLLLERRLGKGTLALLADASPLQNRLLDSSDNAQFALDLSGPRKRPVVFVESLHGFGAGRGLAALPARWWVAFAGLLLAALLWSLARGRRLGVAEPAEEHPQPARADYVHAMSLLLRRTEDPQELSAALIRLRDER